MDEEGNARAEVDDILLTVGVGKDVMIVEQPGDNEDPDLIMIFGKEDGRRIIQLLQAWVDAR